MASLTTRDRRIDRRRGGRSVDDEWWSFAIAFVVMLAIAIVLPVGPDRVSVTIINPTDHRLYITSSTPTDDTRSSVLVVSPRSTATAHDVIDRGPRWVLHLRTLGASAGTIEATRTELSGGSFAVPESINDDLARAGIPTDTTDLESGG